MTPEELAEIERDIASTNPSSSPMGLFRQHCADLISHIKEVEAERDRLRVEVDKAWFGIEHGWDIEPRSYFEEQAPRNGFGSALAMAVHYMWKRKAKSGAVETFRKRVIEAAKAKDWLQEDIDEVVHLLESLPAEEGQT